jgi:D-alanyl-D-alanine carboxypeptidase
MNGLIRATRGGVGAAVMAAALVGLALSAGWLSGRAYKNHLAPAGCAPPCASGAEASSDEVGQVAGISATPAPTAMSAEPEPDGFPFISAKSLAVIDSDCGALIFGRDEHRPLPPASLTKLMTAVVAIEHGDPDTLITSHVDASALEDQTGSTVMGLRPDMQLPLLDLLYGLQLPSGNDAAIAIAEGIAGTQADFVDLMNEKASSLALNDTHFTNAHGLYENGLASSAYDMAMLARYVMQNDTLRSIVGTKVYQPRWLGPPVWNGNRLITERDPELGYDGVKIGYTEESQQTMVASATREGRRIVVSVMRSQDRYSDAERLFDWAFTQPSACP